MDKLRALRVFIAISKYGSLTEAAKKLGTSLPTVVRTLAALETELGIRLFNRTTRRIALTQEGEIYLAHSAALLEEMERVENQLRGDGSVSEGKVKIAAPVKYGNSAVVPILCDIQKRNPQLDFEISLQDRNVDLLEENIDIAVRIAHLDDSSLYARQVGKVRLVLCASPDFLARYKKPLVPEDLCGIPCIQHNGANAGTRVHFKRDGEIIHLKTHGHFTSNMIGATVTACLNGCGVGWFYSYQIAKHVRDGKLRLLLEDFETDPVPVNLVYPHARLMSAWVQFVLKELQSALRQAMINDFALPEPPVRNAALRG